MRLVIPAISTVVYFDYKEYIDDLAKGNTHSEVTKCEWDTLSDTGYVERTTWLPVPKEDK